MRHYEPGAPIVGVSDRVMKCIPPRGPIHAFMSWASQTTHAAPEYLLGAAVPMLMTLFAKAGWSVDGYYGPANYWSVLVGESGSGKSTALKRMRKFLETVMEREQADLYVEPTVMAEGSVPGLLERLSECYDDEVQRTTALLYLDELEHLLRKQQRDNGVCTMMQMLSDGEDYKRNLREYQKMKRLNGKAPDLIHNPHVSGCFCSTAASLEKVFDETMMSQGIFSRLWWFKPDWDVSRLKRKQHQQIRLLDEAVEATRAWFAQQLHSRHVRTPLVKLSAEAEQVLEDYFRQYHELLKANPDSRMNGVLLRAVDKAELLTGAYALSLDETTPRAGQEPSGDPSVIATAADAQRAVATFELNVAAAFKLDERLGVSEQDRWIAKVTDQLTLARSDGLNREELYERTHLSKAKLELAMDQLLDAAKVVELREASSGGRPARRYFLRRYVASAKSQEN